MITIFHINILIVIIQDSNSVEVADKFRHTRTNESLIKNANHFISYKHSDNREVVKHNH